MPNRTTDFLDFSKLTQLPEDEYICKANEQVNNMIRSQMKKDQARFALYNLTFILEETLQGRDSYTILDALKWFLFEFTKADPEIARQAEVMVKNYDEICQKRAEKIKPDI